MPQKEHVFDWQVVWNFEKVGGQNFNMALSLVCLSYQIEWLWQKSNADIIWRKNLLASFGVSLPFLTK